MIYLNQKIKILHNWSSIYTDEILQQITEIIDNKDKYTSEKTRIDLTNLKTYTIDDINSKEIDDAISLEVRDDIKIIWIHIADPSSIIKENSPIDKQARKRAFDKKKGTEAAKALISVLYQK